uniref:Uncharacterized protein n=1 Tax=Oryza sativa subsp. japonica TaxID=39947 RepID=Q5VMJ9_ORYSJ|nr:hypothetical protein [Oryza sativa Japonica Group]BAD69326.1 hypothetical protein [Oryza sativa Japonica Group]
MTSSVETWKLESLMSKSKAEANPYSDEVPAWSSGGPRLDVPAACDEAPAYRQNYEHAQLDEDQSVGVAAVVLRLPEQHRQHDSVNDDPVAVDDLHD